MKIGIAEKEPSPIGITTSQIKNAALLNINPSSGRTIIKKNQKEAMAEITLIAIKIMVAHKSIFFPVSSVISWIKNINPNEINTVEITPINEPNPPNPNPPNTLTKKPIITNITPF